MKLKAIAAAVMGLGVGTALAAPSTGMQKSPQVNLVQSSIVQGNSQLPRMGITFGSAEKNIFFGGMANFDAYVDTDGTWLDGVNVHTDKVKVPGVHFNSTGSTRILVNNANLFVGGNYGIAHAVINVGYFDGWAWSPYAAVATPSHKNQGSGVDNVGLDEAYVNFYDSSLPVYLRVGKFYNAFGNYNPYTQFPSFVDLFTAVNAPGVELGAAYSPNNDGSMTLFANASGFEGDTSGLFSGGAYGSVSNMSANLGIKGKMQGVSYHLNGGFLYSAGDLMAFDLTGIGGAIAASVLHVPAVHVYNAHLGLGYAPQDDQLLSMGVKWAMLDLASAKGSNLKDLSLISINADYNFTLNSALDTVFGLRFDMASDKDLSGTISPIPEYQYGAHFGYMVNKWANVDATYLLSQSFKNFNNKTNTSNTFGLRFGINF